MRDSIVFYRSFYDSLKEIDDHEECLKAIMAIMQYGFDHIEPDGLTGTAKIIFTMAKPQIDANNKRFESGQKGGRPKIKDEPQKPMVFKNKTIGYENKKPNVNVNVNDNDKESKTKPQRFVPPTKDDVMGYCQEKGYSVDAERFIDFYESKGWFVGKNKMKDWKAAVRNWVRQDKADKSSKKGFNNFEEHNYDYSALESDLLRN